MVSQVVGWCELWVCGGCYFVGWLCATIAGVVGWFDMLLRLEVVL